MDCALIASPPLKNIAMAFSTREPEIPISDASLGSYRQYFETLGVVATNWGQFVVNDPTTQNSYKVELPRDWYNARGEDNNIRSYGWLCRCCDWGPSDWNALPELPVALLPRLVPPLQAKPPTIKIS